MTHPFRNLSALAFAAVTLLGLDGCTSTNYGGGGAVYYDYDYYPGSDVYFYPRGNLYYWHEEDGRWLSGGRAPERYPLHRDHPQHLHLRSPEPWTVHRPPHGRNH